MSVGERGSERASKSVFGEGRGREGGGQGVSESLRLPATIG